VMTGGRIVAGVLRGAPNEDITYGTNPAESRGRFEGGVKLIGRAWTEPQPFGWQGRHYEFRDISIWPRPIQKPHPPIYMSGSSPESGEWAARNRIGLGFAVTTVPLAKKAAQHYREQAVIAGWEPSPDDVLYRCGIHVSETDEQAMTDLEAPVIGITRLSRLVDPNVMGAIARAGYHGRDQANQSGRVLQVRSLKESIEVGSLIAGSPETVLGQIRSIKEELGAGILDLNFHPAGREKSLRAIELFGTKVLPRIRDW